MAATMRIHCIAFGVALILSVMATHEVIAQIDGRVDNRVRGMDGRALDRNPMLGSGGINSPGSAYSFDGGFRSRSLITGNLTGLASFHGQTQILQNNGFRGRLPSAGLSSFQARSVGLSQVRSQRALAPTSYLGTQETIPDLGFIRRGLNRPGSSLLISPLTRRPLPTVREARSKLLDLRDPTAALAGVKPDLSTYGTRQRPLASSVAATAGGLGTPSSVDAVSAMSPFGFAADSSIFGSPGPATFRSSVTGESITTDARRSIEAVRLSRTLDRPIDMSRTVPGEGEGGAPVGEEPASVVEASLPAAWPGDPRAARAGKIARLGGERDAKAVERDVFAARGRGALSATEGLVTGLEGDSPQGEAAARPSDLGADKFADFANAVQAAQASGVSRLGFLARVGVIDEGSTAAGYPTAAGERGGVGVIEAQSLVDEQARPRGQSVRETATAVRWADQLLDDPITSFVGMYGGRLNDFIKQAEEAVHGAKCYAAARLFDLAHTIDPPNPPPLLGRGHALIAAGDYMSGQIASERGINRFPQIAAFRLDLPSLIGRHDTYDLRRLDLEGRLESRDHYKLRFVLGYLELYSGLREQGLRNLRRAAELAPHESVITIFPDLLLGRRALPPVGRRAR